MKTLTAIAFALLLVLGGCLELDGQELTLRYDPTADRIDVLIVYRGLFAEGESHTQGDTMAKALNDLAGVRETGKFVLWNNWPFAVDLTGNIKAPAAALAERVDVENGPLFTDPAGMLCGYQFVRIREAKAFVQQVNTLLELGLQAGMATGLRGLDGEPHRFDDDTKELVRDFLRRGDKLLTVEPGRLTLRLPLSAKDHAWVKKQVELQFLDEAPREMVQRHVVNERRGAGGDPGDTSATPGAAAIGGEQLRPALAGAPSFRFFWDNDWSFQREAELTTIMLGVAGDDAVRVRKAPSGLYHPKLLETLREKGEKIEDGVPDQEIARRFAAFHERAAVLPPALAQKRH